MFGYAKITGGAPVENRQQEPCAGQAGKQSYGDACEHIRRIVNADEYARESDQRRPDQEQHAGAAGHEQNPERNRKSRSGVIAREERVMRG